MQLPFFFEEDLPVSNKFVLSEESSKHAVQVLRMRENDQLVVTNGKGHVLTVVITNADKKKTEVEIKNKEIIALSNSKISIAISLIKNANRFEWFLEKAVEIGVSEIVPLICKRTEKYHFRLERMRGILVSAMLQSRQAWLPEISEALKFADVVTEKKNYQQKFIAHCNEDDKKNLNDLIKTNTTSKIILIGPEGDFTEEEINIALQQKYIPVSLGETRLRTETAGIVAAVLLLNNSM